MNLYLIFKSLHIMSLISWMAAIFYLPRLFVYHTQATVGSEMDETLKIMELKLIRIIMNPAMIFTFIFGIALIYEIGFRNLGGWFHLKLCLVLVMAGVHANLAKHRRRFAIGINKKSGTYFRVLNEVPTILMIIIVGLAVIKPF